MITIEYLPQTAFTFMLIFSRLAAMIMLMPALGETSIPANVRLILALLLTFVMMPIVASSYGELPVTVAGLTFVVVTEIAVGLFIGGAARMIMSALHVAGNIIALQMSLAFAQNVDPTQGQQGVLIANFLSLTAVTLIFVTNLDHLLIAAMRDSYHLSCRGRRSRSAISRRWPCSSRQVPLRSACSSQRPFSSSVSSSMSASAFFRG